MKLSRRKLLAGAGASLIAPKKSKAFFPRGVPAALSIKFQQGALGGGGFAFELSSFPDGSARWVRQDLPDMYRWDSTSGKWINNSASPYMDALGVGIQGFDRPHAIGCAWDNQTVYMATNVLPGRVGYINSGGGFFGPDYGQLYKSTDKGQTWFKPGSPNPATDPLTTPLSMGASGHYFQGPALSVDPNNPDVFYYMGWNGSVWVSYDGGLTMTCLVALMRLALPRCFATQNATVNNGVTVTVDSNPIAGNAANVYAAFDFTHPFAMGGSVDDDVAAGSTATTFVVGAVRKNDGTQATTGNPGVIGSLTPGAGDEIFFGKLGGVLVDGSGGTIPNPGGSGVISKLVYFAWSAGATSFWMTADGGSTFTSVGSGGPALLINKMKLSRDASLAPTGGNNVLYVSASAGANGEYWRWVATPPTGSGLVANTWTNLPVNPSDGTRCICPDPLQKGKAVYLSGRGHTYYSTAYGDTPTGAFGSAPIMAAGDTPWIQNSDDLVASDAEFDPVVSNKLWMSDGTGVWYNFPFNNANQPTFTANMQALQSLIIGQITKTPSPNGKIYLGMCQDRPIIRCIDAQTVPTGYFPGTSVGNTGGPVCYSLNDPTQVFAVNSNNVIQDAGTTSGTNTQDWNAITTPGVNGWPVASLGRGLIHSRSSTELFINALGMNLQYGTKSGGVWSWTNSLVLGSAFAGQGTDAFGKHKNQDIDRVSGTIYFVDTTTPGAKALYKSVDGGANFSRPGAANGAAAFLFNGNGSGIVAVPGFDNHVFLYSGYAGDGSIQAQTSTPLTFTNDGGVTWNRLSTFAYSFACCVGPIAPGSAYPTIYVLGRLTTETNLFKASLYRCTDFNSSTFAGTWVDVGANLPKVECCSQFQGGLAPDPESWSTFYLASNDTGYVKGFLA